MPRVDDLKSEHNNKADWWWVRYFYTEAEYRLLERYIRERRIRILISSQRKEENLFKKCQEGYEQLQVTEFNYW